MVKDDKRGHRAWWRTLPGAAGLALVVAAALLWASGVANPWVPTAHAQTATPTNTPTATNTPTPTATPNPNCDLNVTKTDSPDPVAEGGKITYTIKVANDGDGSGSCTDFTVTDEIPTDTDCVSIDVTDDAGLDVNFDTDDCDASGTITWDTTDNLDTGDEVVLEMVVELTSGASDGDSISNEACATSTSDVNGDCDTEKTKVGAGATSTPAPTATVAVPTVRPPAPVAPPVAPPPPPAPAPTTLIAPLTGSGTESGVGGSQPLALALGLAGGCLLLLSGAAMLRRPR